LEARVATNEARAVRSRIPETTRARFRESLLSLLVAWGGAETMAGTTVVVVGSVVSTAGAVVEVVEDDVLACGEVVVVVAPGAVVVVGPGAVTTTKPTMLGCSSQWYRYVPSLTKRWLPTEPLGALGPDENVSGQEASQTALWSWSAS
jgi:hypothetical protein